VDHADHGVLGCLLRKFDFDPAPLVLGLVIAPTFEVSLRQSLVMSSGDWLILFRRPIAATLVAAPAQGPTRPARPGRPRGGMTPCAVAQSRSRLATCRPHCSSASKAI
jgi:hypothetical protein